MTTSDSPSGPATSAGSTSEVLPSDILHDYCMAKPGATFDHVFGPQTTVYRVMNKVFLLVGQDARPQYATFSYDPEESLLLRETYESVVPGYYANKRLCNTVYYTGEVSVEQSLEWVDASYDIVVAKLPRKLRDQLHADG
ncbi:MmcQ/YjbR family DNA-binding protein [Micromonospora sp. NPDC047134]|uniref:MmcQ/YjbR family DNA-binding protein n=1 Tax=Micromonospora sp. NPDC047134 TaxID=3154340 RepID=UPI0033E801A4